MASGSGPDSDPNGDVEITREEAPAATAAVG
jgi:hypothetical protein